MNVATPASGQPLTRVEGRAKVRGEARYAAEFPFDGLTHGALIQSTVARGRVTDVDVAAASRAPGVLGVMTAVNAPRFGPYPADITEKGLPGERRPPLSDDRIHYAGQHLGIVVADTLERARFAASLVRVSYADVEPPILDPADPRAVGTITEPEKWVGREPLQTRRGEDVAGIFSSTPPERKVEARYVTPVENHQPMEPYGTIAAWEGMDRLLLFETTRSIQNLRKVLAAAFGLPLENFRIRSPLGGGAFGSKGFQFSHLLLTAAAARLVGRPVRLVLSRAQMFDSAGQRARTVQDFALAADERGKLTAIRHDTLTHCAPTGEYTEPCGTMTKRLYACPNVAVTHRLARVNLTHPCPMRAPGEAPGVFALECALDELAENLGMDPLELRRRNHADTDENDRKPWSAKHLLECYDRAAARFGWAGRNPRPRATRDPADGKLVGWGMATSVYPANQMPAAAKAVLLADGTAVVRSATYEFGTGTYTAMTQLAADALGLPPDRVRFELGDSAFPPAPANGGSWLTASVGRAVVDACRALVEKLTAVALADAGSPLRGAVAEGIAPAGDGKLGRGSARDAYADILRRAGLASLEAEAAAKPGPEREKFAFESFGALFCEVKVDRDLGEVRVTRLVGCYDVGRVLNPRLARSQILGGVIFGLGMALTEATVPDAATGRIVNANLAEYHLPVCADVPETFDVELLDRPDPHMAGGLGIRGIGEIGVVGAAAAVANAVWHATGVRVRELPISPDKLLV